jgi:hypothetical protein
VGLMSPTANGWQLMVQIIGPQVTRPPTRTPACKQALPACVLCAVCAAYRRTGHARGSVTHTSQADATWPVANLRGIAGLGTLMEIQQHAWCLQLPSFLNWRRFYCRRFLLTRLYTELSSPTDAACSALLVVHAGFAGPQIPRPTGTSLTSPVSVTPHPGILN